MKQRLLLLILTLLTGMGAWAVDYNVMHYCPRKSVNILESDIL